MTLFISLVEINSWVPYKDIKGILFGDGFMDFIHRPMSKILKIN
jgi:hypothetical protein